jgi:hypothetical protein
MAAVDEIIVVTVLYESIQRKPRSGFYTIIIVLQSRLTEGVDDFKSTVPFLLSSMESISVLKGVKHLDKIVRLRPTTKVTLRFLVLLSLSLLVFVCKF